MPPVLLKETLVEIRRSLGRFLSILLIVALGVAFFAGVKASPPDMKASADDYFDRYGLQDIQVFSTLGLDRQDLDAMREVPGVESVQGLYNQDVLVRIDKSEQVWKLFSLPENPEMNLIRVEEGRLPEKPDECLIEGGSMESGLKGTFAIGDKVRIESGTKDPLSDTLKHEEYTVVGKGFTPRYLSFEKGTSAIGSGSVDGFLFVPEAAVKSGYYTEADVTVSGARELDAYSDAYFDVTDPVVKKLEAIADARIEARLKDPRQELTDARQQLKDETEKGEKQLADARQQIRDGEAEIADSEKTLTDSRSQLDAGWAQLNQGQAQLDSLQQQVSSGLAQIRQAQAQKASLEQAQAQIRDGLTQAQTGRDQAQAGLDQINAGLTQIDAGLAQIDTAALAAQKQQLETGIASLQAQIAAVEATDPAAAQAMKAQLAQLQASLAQVQGALDTAADLQAQKTQLEAQKQTAQAGLEEADTAIADLNAKQKQVNDGLAQIQAAEARLPELEAAQAQIDASRSQLETSRNELNIHEGQYQSGQAQLEQGRRDLTKAKAELADGETKLKEETEKGQKKIEDAQKELDELEPQWIVLDRNSFYSYRDYQSCADRMDGIASVFPVFFFLVAALVCMTTMTRMVDEQRSTIGTLKALGYAWWQIAMKYILYSLLASILGSILGCAVGMVVFPCIIFYAWNTMYTIDTIKTVWQPGLMLLASGSVTLVILVTTLFSIGRELREVPSQLMRPKAGVAGKQILLEKVPAIWQRIPFLHKVTLRNIFRYKKRFFMTVIGISGCSALLVAGFGINDSISSIVSEQFGAIYQYDAAVTADNDALSDPLKKLEGVTGVYEEQDLPVTLDMDGNKAAATLHIIPDGTQGKKLTDFVHLDSLDKEPLTVPEEGALVSQKMAEKLGLKPGSKLTLETADDQKLETTVADVFSQYVGHQVYVSQKTFDDWHVAEQPQDVYLLKTSDQSDDFEEALGGNIMLLDDVRSVSFYSKLQQNFLDMIGSIKMVVVVLVISAAMLAFVVLYNLANVNISERMREIATIKVLGYTEREVDAYVNRESLILAMIGGGTGLILGIWLHRLIMNLAELDDVMFGRIISPLSYLFAFGLTVLFALLVNFVMRFRLRKVEMVESLKAVE